MFNLRKVKAFRRKISTGLVLLLFVSTTAQAATYRVIEGASRPLPLYSIEGVNHERDGDLYPGQKLNLVEVVSNKGVIPYSQSDLNLLARLVRAEAENQPYSAKVAVAAVVINRVQSNQFPNNIREVIFQRVNGYHQFTPVKNGAISKASSQEDIRAAREALGGADPTKGALFYFDDSATNEWLWSKPLAARIDDMVFVY